MWSPYFPIFLFHETGHSLKSLPTDPSYNRDLTFVLGALRIYMESIEVGIYLLASAQSLHDDITVKSHRFE